MDRLSFLIITGEGFVGDAGLDVQKPVQLWSEGLVFVLQEHFALHQGSLGQQSLAPQNQVETVLDRVWRRRQMPADKGKAPHKWASYVLHETETLLFRGCRKHAQNQGIVKVRRLRHIGEGLIEPAIG